VDSTFGAAGQATLSGDPVSVIADRADRPVVLTAGAAQPAGSARPEVTRLTTTGQIDATFAGTGTADATPDLGLSAYKLRTANPLIVAPLDLAVTRANGVVVSGRVSDTTIGSLGFLTQLTPTGTRDAAFGSARTGTEIFGPRRMDPLTPATIGQSVSVEPLFGNIYAAGIPTGDTRSIVWKRTARGSRYGAFAIHGWLRLYRSAPNPLEVAATCDGGVVVGETNALRKYRRSGAPDSRVGSKGVVTIRRGTLLDHLDAARADERACAVGITGVSARVRQGRGGVAITWLPLPR